MKLSLFLALALVPLCAAQNPAGPLRFRITLASQAAASPVTGRMLVFMSSDAELREELPTEFSPGAVAVAAMEFEHIAPGETVEFIPDVRAYPGPLSKSKAGEYQFMALLDCNHDYAQAGSNGDDLVGPVVRARIDPANTKPIALSLTRRHSGGREYKDTKETKIVTYESALLGAFWGRPITVRAGVVLPPSYAASGERRYPAVYVLHGFGGDYRDAFGQGHRMRRAMEQGKAMESVLVFLDGSCPTGDHEFADSVNNGPWGRALIEEFIPFLERRFRLIPESGARFLTGHSSGGWASLWLQVTYPGMFGGTWSTSPDPVDFRSFSGADVTPGSRANVYRDAAGRPRNLIRKNGKELVSFEQWAKQEEVLGEYGGQLASFEWVFSPKGEDGRPRKLFNRVTGELDGDVERAWQKYDIRRNLAEHWKELAPALKGKLHIICGSDDTFHLEEAAGLLCQFLKEQSGGACEMVPGRDHMDLYEPYRTYPDGLAQRIAREMQAQFETAK